MHRITFAAGAICLAVLAGSAAAQSAPLKRGFSFDPSVNVAYTHVPYDDLDPTSAAGARTLLARIEAAAEAVCDRGPAQDSQARAECVHIAVAGAVAKMRSPSLTALASGRQDMRRAAR